MQSPHNASGYFTIFGDESSYADHFNSRLVTGNTGEVYARTGYLGFLRRTENVQADGGLFNKKCNYCVFVKKMKVSSLYVYGKLFCPLN